MLSHFFSITHVNRFGTVPQIWFEGLSAKASVYMKKLYEAVKKGADEVTLDRHANQVALFVTWSGWAGKSEAK